MLLGQQHRRCTSSSAFASIGDRDIQFHCFSCRRNVVRQGAYTEIWPLASIRAPRQRICTRCGRARQHAGVIAARGCSQRCSLIPVRCEALRVLKVRKQAVRLMGGAPSDLQGARSRPARCLPRQMSPCSMKYAWSMLRINTAATLRCFSITMNAYCITGPLTRSKFPSSSLKL